MAKVKDERPNFIGRNSEGITVRADGSITRGTTEVARLAGNGKGQFAVVLPGKGFPEGERVNPHYVEDVCRALRVVERQ
jgi:hypothetical protein